MSMPAETERARLLLVDDEPNVLSALRRVFAMEPYDVEIFTQPAEALAAAKLRGFDVVISDYRMPEVDGVAFLTILRSMQPDTIRLVLSGYTDLDGLLKAINEAEIYRYITKPWNEYDLRATVAQALVHRETLLENRRLAEQVRAQQQQIDQQQEELLRLEKLNPGITHVERDPDGSIIINRQD